MIKQLRILLFFFFVCLFLGASMKVYAEDENQIANSEVMDSVTEDTQSKEDLDCIDNSISPKGLSEIDAAATIGESEESRNEVSVSKDLNEEAISGETKEDLADPLLEKEGIAEEKPYQYKPGWNYVNGYWFYGDSDGTAKTGWLQNGANWYYLKTVEEDPDTPGSMVANCAYIVKDMIYSFFSSGAMKTGWQYENGNWFYYASNGDRKLGTWLCDKTKWYYLTDKTESLETSGVMARSSQLLIKDMIYSFNDSGEMKTGWQRENGNWYYYKTNGDRALGEWLKDSGIWYYFKGKTDAIETTGVMAHGEELPIRNAKYRFKDDGSMLQGWFLDEDGWYYYRNSGSKILGGFEKIQNQYYYFLSELEDVEHPGIMFNGDMLEIDGIKHFFDSNGNTHSGWFKPDGWYYYDEYGVKKTNWIYLDRLWYYLNPSDEGRMYVGWLQWKNNWYFLKNDGAMATGWQYVSGTYYFKLSGEMFTGWLDSGSGNWYYLYPKDRGPEGTMARNTVIDGYYVARNGLYNKTYQKAYNILNRIGWTVRAAFNYASTLPYQTFSTNGGLGSLYFADYGFSNGRGNCYVMAATFYVMATLLGEEVHQISGYVPLRSGGMGPHSWVETIWNGTLYICDPNFQYYGNNGYYIRYGQKGTWRYSNYYRMN